MEQELAVSRLGAHAALERGDIDAYESWLKKFQDHADTERPGTRRNALHGYAAALLGAKSGEARRIRERFTLRPEEIERTGVKERAPDIALAQIRKGEFPAVRDLFQAGLLDPSFFHLPEIVDAAQRSADITGSGHVVVDEWDAKRFGALFDLPFPDEFFAPEAIRDSVATMVPYLLTNGIPGALAAIRHIEKTHVEKRLLRIEATRGIASLLERRDFQNAEAFAKAFDIDMGELAGWSNVRNGYKSAVSFGDLSDILTFERLFRAIRASLPEETVIEGLTRLWSKQQQPAAKAFDQHFRPAESIRLTAAERAAVYAMRRGDERALAFLRDTIRVPTSVIQEAAQSVVSSDTVVAMQRAQLNEAVASIERVRRMARMKREDLVPGIIDGIRRSYRQQTLDKDRPAPPLMPLREAATYFGVPNASMRAVGRALAAENFTRRRPDFNDEARRTFGLGDDDMDAAAKEVCVFAMSRWEGKGVEDFVSETLNAAKNPETLKQDPVLRAAAMKFIRSEFEKLRPQFAMPVRDIVGLSDDEMREVGRQAKDAIKAKTVELMQLFRRESDLWDLGRPNVMLPAGGLTWEDFTPADIPFDYLLAPEHPDLRAHLEADPWYSGIQRALKIQGRSANVEHDPWVREARTLIDKLLEDGILDRASKMDGDLIVEYVKTFGLYDLPNVARIYFRLKRGTFAELPDGDKKLLVELVGPKAARLESEHLINELRKLRGDIQRDLLADKIPRKVGTVLGEEVFNIVRGTSKWEQGDRPGEIFRIWRQTVETAKAGGSNENVEVAAGYEEMTFAVPILRRVEADNPEARKAKELELLAAEPLVGWTDRLRHALERAERIHDTGIEGIPGIPDFDPEVARELNASPFEANDERLVAHMESVAALPANDETNRVLLTLSVLHVQAIARDWSEALETEPGNEKGFVREVSGFLRQYLLEHYLNPAQNPKHVGHRPFSETLRAAVERAWGLSDGIESHIVTQTDKRLTELEPRAEVGRETVDITLVPVQGPARIYSGEIGDACFSSKHVELASGQYPGIKAAAFVTNRNKPKERLNGSILFVETRLAATDSRTIVVRANNPRQNLVAQVDAKSLVRQTIGAAIATARLRKIKHVGLVRDEASMASSNREAVSTVYEEEYGYLDPVELVNEPETNFNGYDIWNAEGYSPTVIVWTNDDPEAT